MPADTGSDGGSTTVTPQRSPALGLSVADAHSRDVGDRVARAGLEPADGAGDVAPALSASVRC